MNFACQAAVLVSSNSPRPTQKWFGLTYSATLTSTPSQVARSSAFTRQILGVSPNLATYRSTASSIFSAELFFFSSSNQPKNMAHSLAQNSYLKVTRGTRTYVLILA